MKDKIWGYHTEGLPQTDPKNFLPLTVQKKNLIFTKGRRSQTKLVSTMQNINFSPKQNGWIVKNDVIDA